MTSDNIIKDRSETLIEREEKRKEEQSRSDKIDAGFVVLSKRTIRT